MFICLSSLNLVLKYAAWESAKLSLNNRAADDDYCYCHRLWSCYLLYKPRDTSAMLFSCTELDVSCAWGKIMDPGALDKNHCLPSKDLSLRIIKFNLYRSSGDLSVSWSLKKNLTKTKRNPPLPPGRWQMSDCILRLPKPLITAVDLGPFPP